MADKATPASETPGAAPLNSESASPASTPATAAAPLATSAPEPTVAPELTAAKPFTLLPEADPEAKVERLPLAELKAVIYVGVHDKRIITEDDLSSLGVTSLKHSGDLVFTPGVGVDIKSLNADTVDALLTVPEFSVV